MFAAPLVHMAFAFTFFASTIFAAHALLAWWTFAHSFSTSALFAAHVLSHTLITTAFITVHTAVFAFQMAIALTTLASTMLAFHMAMAHTTFLVAMWAMAALVVVI